MGFRNLESQLLFPELEQAVRTGDEEALGALCESLGIEDLAELVEELEEQGRIQFFEHIPLETGTEVFSELEVGMQKEILADLGRHRVAELINEMEPDDRTALLEELPLEVTKELLSFLRPRERAQAQRLLSFPEDSVARLMTPDFMAVHKEWSVSRTLDFIRRNGEDKETLNDIYVVDAKGRLVDDLPIREFLLADPKIIVEELMDGQYMALKATDPDEEAIAAFRKYSTRTALPVVDEHGLLLGIVTIDDILHLEERETTEDIHKLGGVGPLTNGYLDTSIASMLLQRGFWLTLLFVGEMLTASAMGFYEIEISKTVVLALFIPLIISSGGNSGSQAATLVIRAIALGEVAFSDLGKVLRRELIVGLGLGLVLGIIGFMRIGIVHAITAQYGAIWLPLGFAIFLSLIGVVTWGTIIGSLMPLLLKRLGMDPATSSAPFVATFIDVTGIILYFNIAMLVLGKMDH